jgi:type VI secretion system protein ImpC
MIDPNEGLEGKFTLESEKGGVVEEPPFRILVLGDWSGDGDKKPLAERRPIDIDRDEFDTVLSRLGVKADLAPGSTSLTFSEIEDFHPDQIFRSLPIFTELRDLRRRLRDESTFNAAAREVRERFGLADAAGEESDGEPEAAPQTEAPEIGGGLLDSILAKPSGGGAAPKPGISRDVADLVNEAVRPHLVSVDEGEQSQLVSALDAATSSLMRRILADPKFKELEAAWRGLYFLVRRTETSPELKIHILDISKAELADNLKDAASLADTEIYRHVIRDSIETPGGEPYAVVLGNYAFEPNIDDVAALIRISKIAAAANAPFISHMRPDVFGVHSLDESPDPAGWNLGDHTDEGKLWTALRDQTESVYLGMAIPRFLARLPYGADTEPLDSFAFEEFDGGAGHNSYVWSNPCFAVGQLLAASFAEYGWEMGNRLRQDIEGLPVHVYKSESETVYKPCSEVLLTDTAMQKLMDIGLMPLITYKNSDRVKLARYHSIADTALRGMWN